MIWSAPLLYLGCNRSKGHTPTNLGEVDPSQPKIAKINKTSSEWKKILTPEQYGVLREEDTEAKFSSPLNAENVTGSLCVRVVLCLFLKAKTSTIAAQGGLVLQNQSQAH